MYEGLPVGLATCVLSLSTNLLATVLVGYKAWYVSDSSIIVATLTEVLRESRRRLKGYLVAGSQVEKLLALLLESGAIYCGIWVCSVHFPSLGLGSLITNILIRA